MSVERNLLISLLKLTNTQPALIEDVNIDAHVPSSTGKKLLEKMQLEQLIYLNSDTVEVDTVSRVKIAVKAVTLGADIQNISNFLRWQEFEEIAALALNNHGYSVKKNMRFKHESKRREIDIVGCSKPLVVCIDCKHWGHALAPSELKKIVEAQIQRTEALAKAIPNPKVNLQCSTWDKAKLIPAVLSLMPCAYKYYYDVPIIPVLKLQDFLHQLPAYAHELKAFNVTFNKLGQDAKD